MFLSVNGLDLHLHQSGPADAEALLLLHSLGTQAAIWETAAEAFAPRYRVLRPDLRGHGLSGVTPGPYSIEGLTHDILALLDKLAIERAHVAGISIGGMMAQSLASLAPERVRSLILVDTALSIPPAQSWCERAALVRSEGMEKLIEPVVARWVTAASLQTPEAHALRRMLRQTDPEGYAAAAEAIAAADLRHAVAKLNVPTLVLVGEEDAATPISSAEALRDSIPGAQLAIIHGAAHIPTMERPDHVIERMRSFLDAIPKHFPYYCSP